MPLPGPLQQLIRAAVACKVQVTDEPVHYPIASTVASVAAASSPKMRQVAHTALEALGQEPTSASVWEFTRDWWYARAVGEVLAYDADRLTREWAEKYVSFRGVVPTEGAILVSIHQFSQHVAAARAASLLGKVGLVTMADIENGEVPAEEGFLLPSSTRARPLSRFYRRVFGDELYPPGAAARRGLQLLRGGGSLIVLADFYGNEMGSILGRSIPVAPGATWWARLSGRPIVPFWLVPPRRGERQWLLECGAPLWPTQHSLVRALEAIVRRAPTTWMSWRGWAESPPWPARSEASAAASSSLLNSPLLASRQQNAPAQ